MNFVPVLLSAVLFQISNGNNITEETDQENEIRKWIFETEKRKTHFALDNRRALKLAMAEEKLDMDLIVSGLFNLGAESLEEQECLQNLEKYLKSYWKDSHTLPIESVYLKAKAVVENPLRLLRMIRRLLLLKIRVIEPCPKLAIEKIVNNSFSAVDKNLPLPTKNDLEDAQMAIIRIHYVYGFSAKEIRLGRFHDVSTNVALDFEECLELGQLALELNSTVLAYQWFSAASLTLVPVKGDPDPLTPSEWKAFYGKLNESWTQLLNRTGLRSRKELRKYMSLATPEIPEKVLFEYEDYATCRGESSMPEEEKSHLNCVLLAGFLNPYWTIQPLKVEVLHMYPHVWQFHDFVGNKTIDYIKTTVRPELIRSATIGVNNTKRAYTTKRASMTAWMADNEFSDPGELITKLNKRMELCTNLKIRKFGASEDLQVAEYSAGGHFNFHDDALRTRELIEKNGDRLATFLIFLSDVRMGGYTGFPRLTIYAKPIKGSAILWYSSKRNGEMEGENTHGGCPVILGSKMIANKWILQHENMFKHKCSLNPED